MTKKETPLPRQRMLDEAGGAVSGQRDHQYGSPEDNFSRIAEMWTVLFNRKFTSEEIAMAFVAVKLSRLCSQFGFQPDTWVDIAGYAACGYEVAENVTLRTPNHGTVADR